MKLTLPDNNNNWWLQNKFDSGQEITPIAKLFLKLNSLYMGQLKREAGSDDEMRELMTSWADELQRNGITGVEARTALDLCLVRHPSFLPKCGEFILCARPAINHRSAHAEACEQMHQRDEGDDRWSNPAIYWAAVKIGAYDLRNTPYDQIKTRWTSALDEFLLMGADIAEVPARAIALPAPGNLTVSDAEAKKRMANIMFELTRKFKMQNASADSV
jgi:hypothetical protein